MEFATSFFAAARVGLRELALKVSRTVRGSRAGYMEKTLPS